MANDSKLDSRPVEDNHAAQLISVVSDALVKLITTGTNTVVALGILAILAAIILRASFDVQQQIVPLLTGMLGVIVGRMLTQSGTSSDTHLETPDPSQKKRG